MNTVDSCRICGNNNLVEILNLGVQTLSGRFPSTKDEIIPAYPLVLVKCIGNNTCGLVQLKHDVNRDQLYRHFYGYMSGLNTTMKTHLQNLVLEAMKKVSLEDGDVVIDIGSNDGTTLKFYQKNLVRIGIDPTGHQFKEFYTDDLILIPEYFNSELIKKYTSRKAKIITSIAMFYDLPDPVSFAKEIKTILDSTGVWITEQSYLPEMLNTNSFDTVCHEHVEYYTLKQMSYIAAKAGLKIIDISFNDINGGSFRVSFTHQDKFDFSFPRIYHQDVDNIKTIVIETEEKELNQGLNTLKPFEQFAQRCEEMKKNFISFVQREKSLGKTFAVYGASTKGNVLLQYYGLDYTVLDCVAERNPYKYGKFTPKTLIPILSEDEVRQKKPDYMIVLPWHFKAEFLKREKEYMDQGGKLVFPLPTLQILPEKKSASLPA